MKRNDADVRDYGGAGDENTHGGDDGFESSTRTDDDHSSRQQSPAEPIGRRRSSFASTEYDAEKSFRTRSDDGGDVSRSSTRGTRSTDDDGGEKHSYHQTTNTRDRDEDDDDDDERHSRENTRSQNNNSRRTDDLLADIEDEISELSFGDAKTEERRRYGDDLDSSANRSSNHATGPSGYTTLNRPRYEEKKGRSSQKKDKLDEDDEDGRRSIQSDLEPSEDRSAEDSSHGSGRSWRSNERSTRSQRSSSSRKLSLRSGRNHKIAPIDEEGQVMSATSSQNTDFDSKLSKSEDKTSHSYANYKKTLGRWESLNDEEEWKSEGEQFLDPSPSERATDSAMAAMYGLPPTNDDGDDNVDGAALLLSGLTEDDLYRANPAAATESKLPDDMFSFLVTAPIFSIPFITGTLVTLLKVLFYILLVINLLNQDTVTEANPLGVPSMTPTWSLAAAQILGLAICPLIEDDLIKGLAVLREGYHNNTDDLDNLHQGFSSKAGLGRAFPTDISSKKWMAAVVWQILVGSLGLTTFFFLIVTSTDVFLLLLSFAAVRFIALLDRTMFILAKNNFLGKRNKQEAVTIATTRYKVPASQKRAWFLGAIFAIFASLLLMGWIVVFIGQLQGRYAPKHLIVQFSDEVDQKLGYFSGMYTRAESATNYVEDRGLAVLSYCRDKLFWTIRTIGDNSCKNYFAHSTSTAERDLAIIGSLPWYARDTLRPSERFYPLERFYLQQACRSNDECGENGACEDSKCVCESGYFGLACDFSSESTCPSVAIDEQTELFRSKRQISTEFSVLVDAATGEAALVYDHPIYVNKRSPQSGYDIIVFTGLRWLLTSTDGLNGLRNATLESMNRFFSSGSFHASLSFNSINLYSAPAYVNTPTDQASPIGTAWFQNIEDVTPTPTKLICSVCDGAFNPCKHRGICLNTGQCECQNGAYGVLCQIAPLGDGKCDQFFNSAAYDYDEGDCCESTCRDTDTVKCGVVENSLVVGFPFCKDPQAGCDGSGDCWAPKAIGVALLSSQQTSAVEISSGGTVLVVGEVDLKSIRVYDQDDGTWVERGPALEETFGNFGQTFAVHTPRALVGRRFGVVPLVLAATSSSDSTAVLRLEYWGPNSVEWLQLCEFNLCIDGNGCRVASVGIGKRGRRVTVSVAFETESVDVFEAILGNGDQSCRQVFTTRGQFSVLDDSGDLIATVSRSNSEGTFGVFDISNRDFDTTKTLDRESDGNLLSERAQQFLRDQVLSRTPPMAFAAAGRFFHVVLLSQGDSSVSVQSLAFNKDIGLFDVSASSDLGVRASSALERPSAVEFSSDGAALGIQGLSAGTPMRLRRLQSTAIHVFQMKPSDGGDVSWTPLASTLESDSVESAFAVSSFGNNIVAQTDDGARVFRVSSSCGENEAPVRLSISLDGNPRSVSWFLEGFAVTKGLIWPNETLAGCSSCYDESYGMVVEDACIPRGRLSCLRLRFRADIPLGDGAGFALLIDGNEVGQYDRAAGDEQVVFASSDIASCEDPSSISGIDSCGNQTVPVALALTLDQYAAETQWSLDLLSQGNILRSPAYSRADAGSTQVYSLCAPPSECLRFTIEDEGGDGICCTSGFGQYSLFYDNVEVRPVTASFSGESQSALFGSFCPETNSPSVSPVDTFFRAPFDDSIGSVNDDDLLFNGSNDDDDRSNDDAPIGSDDDDFTSVNTGPPTSSPTRNPSSAPTNAPTTSTPTGSPTASPSLVPTPEIEVSILIKMDDDARSISWTLVDLESDALVDSREAGAYTGFNDQMVREVSQIYVGRRYEFCIFDEVGDGLCCQSTYSINYAGWPQILGDGSNLESERCHTFRVSSAEVEDAGGL